MCRDAELVQNLEHDALERAHIADDVDGVWKTKNRIDHELAGAMPGDLATPIDVDDRDVAERALVGEGAFACGVHGIMFKEDHGVWAITGDDGLMDGALKGKALEIRHGVGA